MYGEKVNITSQVLWLCINMTLQLNINNTLPLWMNPRTHSLGVEVWKAVKIAITHTSISDFSKPYASRMAIGDDKYSIKGTLQAKFKYIWI